MTECKQRTFPVVLVVGVLLAGIQSAGCAPDISDTDFYSRHPDPVDAQPTGPVLLEKKAASGVALAVLRNDQVHAGYNELILRAATEGTDEPIVGVSFDVVASTVIDGATYVSPIIDDASPSDAAGEATLGILFLQPRGSGQSWRIDVSTTIDGAPISFPFDIVVRDSLTVQPFVGAGGQSFFAAWIEPIAPKTGEGPLELAVYRDTGSAFDPVENASIDLYPYMDMGGGDGHSTPFTKPTHTSVGRYAGTINFIMSGGWDLTAYLTIGAAPADTVVFKGFTVH